jgi:Bacterial Ig-like domain (group 2)
MRFMSPRTRRTAAWLALIACVACRRGHAQLTTRPATASLGVGDTITIQALLATAAGEPPATVDWSSDNDAVARVDGNGHVTARSAGITGITARRGTDFATTRVTVSPDMPRGQQNTVASLTTARALAPAPAPPPTPARAAPSAAPSTPPAAAAKSQSAPAVAARPVVASSGRMAPMARRSARSPHFAHISVFYTDFYARYASPSDQRAVFAFLGPRIDAVMSGPRDQWKAIDPTILYFPYALQFTVPVPGAKTAHDDIASGYFADMQSWYQAHGNYDIENAFLHRGGHDEAHRVQLKIWDSMRYVVNPADPGQRAYQVDRLSRVAQGQDGVFLDEFGGGMSGASKPSDEFVTSADYMAAETQLISQVHDAIKPRFLLMNIAEYWTPADSALVVAAGGAHLERTNFPFTDRLPSRWTEIDHLLAQNVYTEFVTLWTYTDWVNSKTFPSFQGGMYSSPLERGQLVQLASYYMAVPKDPERFSYDQQNMWNVRPDTVWMPALEADVGHPREARHVIASGVDAAAQKYSIYARDFDNAYVVIRPQLDWRKQTYADSTGITVPLPAPMRPLHRDGTLGDPVSSVTLRNVEAAILFK